MTKSLISVSAAVALFVGAAAMQAHEPAKSSPNADCRSGSCPSGGCSKGDGCSLAGGCPFSGSCPKSGCESSSGCPVTAAMNRLPRMTFAVAEEKTNCPKTAKALSTKSGAPIHYVVAGKNYATESEAKLALVEATEKFVSEFAKPHGCPSSGTLTVAGRKMSCEKSAAATAKVVTAAMEKVTLAYHVGEKSCACPNQAKHLAETSGQKIIYAVGEEKTECNVTARLNLARAKYKAAVEALLATEKTTTDTKKSA